MTSLLTLCLATVAITPLQQAKPAGYLATPPSGKGQGVLVLHAWWGLNADTKAFCSRLAKSGYVAFAPDLYRGKVAKTIPEAEALLKALNSKQGQAKKDIANAANFLAYRTKRPFAVIGFSMGANYALELSALAPQRVRSVVLFYGTGDADFRNSRAAYQGHFAERDKFEERTYVNGLEKTLRDEGRPVKFYHYRGTGHWFFEPTRKDAYNKSASDLAWQRTLSFLKTNKP